MRISCLQFILLFEVIILFVNLPCLLFSLGLNVLDVRRVFLAIIKDCCVSLISLIVNSEDTSGLRSMLMTFVLDDDRSL